MAEFKLGRIKFVWKDAWSASTLYFVDDVVRYGAKTYICTSGHTANTNFNVDLDIVPSKWNQMSNGQDWKGPWQISTLYKLNDLVKYGGAVYICQVSHASSASSSLGLESLLSNWSVFVPGQEWTGDWSTSTRYKLYDLVKYGGKTFICVLGHTSAVNLANGLELDLSKWDEFTQGTAFKGVWSPGVRYKDHDLVTYGASTWFCNTFHTSGATFIADVANWIIYTQGFEYESDWSNSSPYQTGDIVKYGGNLYIAIVPNLNKNPLLITTDWALLIQGIQYQSTYSISTQYKIGSVVNYGGNTYYAQTDVTPIAIVVTSSSAATNSFLTTSTTGLVAGKQIIFSGNVIGGVVAGAIYYVRQVLNSAEFTISLTSGGSVFGLLTASGSSTATVSIAPPDVSAWFPLASGFSWKNTWSQNQSYVLSDAVAFGSNSYICIQAHTSQGVGGSPLSRPDLDTAGLFWNTLSVGDPVSVLTTRGDLVYYGNAGPARLPVGIEGQLLRVSETLDPEWITLGSVNHVFYVSQSGRDTPAPINGLSIDKSWKTLRYACLQVDHGPLNPEARNLLDRNRAFIQREVISWINVQVAGNTAPFTAGFVYNSANYERHIGFIIDSLSHDLGHGGNVRSRASAISYATDPLPFYAAGQSAQVVAAINYSKLIIGAVLANTVPVPVYQGIVTQVVDLSNIAELSANATVSGLISIVTGAVLAGNTTTIPVEIKPFSTIFLKTGAFNEVLPIIIPESTAIVGDELRSTTVLPAPSVVDSTDVQYSIAAITRIASIISNVVQNIAIAPTAGNPLLQVTSRPAAGISAGSFAADTLTSAISYINFHLNAVGSAPVITGTNAPTNLASFYAAAAVLRENAEFLAEEAVAFINLTFPAYSYNTALYKRDINEYIVALRKDLVYTGNYHTLLAARYYRRAVAGSLTEDMFYARNTSGLRNLTVRGLTGTLGPMNQYGTQRPTAGAFVSLDPGWGPDDTRGWITTRSPYVQNVTTFGTGCVGLKVDGALHNGGNDSIVANDFTQIISDGIGAWVTNLGRAELVSVFSYYGHIGYLAENGGKIRATNGNTSYGGFGCVSEGFDTTEVPNTALVDNTLFVATASVVNTDRASNVLNFEFDNAGSEYTEATWNITGPGVSASVEADEFRDRAVFQIRLLDLFNEDSTLNPEAAGNFGGFGYLTNSNSAQGGTLTQITIAATDQELSSSYIGMKVLLTGGRGAGQFGIITTYDAGTKVATVVKETTGVAGWDHIVPGFTILSLDASTTYIIEPAVSITAPAYSSTGRTLSASANWSDVKYAETVKTYLGVTGSASAAGTAAAFNVTRKGTKYTADIVVAGAGYARFETILITGTTLDGITPVNNLTVTVLSVSTSGEILAIDIKGLGSGGRFVTVATGTSVTSASNNGQTWIAGGAMPATATWNSLASGRLTAIELAGAFVIGRSYTITSVGNTNWLAIGSLANIEGITFIATGVGGGSGTAKPNASHIVAIPVGSTSAYSTNGGVTWNDGGALPAGATWNKIAYGDGKWIAVSTDTNQTAQSINGGITWTSAGTLPIATNWRDIVYGKGLWIAVSYGTVAARSSNGGITWTNTSIPTSSWASVAYGNNRFVAVSADVGTVAAISLDGTNWIETVIDSSSQLYIEYGQGVFIASGAGTTAFSSEDGIIWTSRVLGTASPLITFGNPSSNPIWVGVSAGSTTAASIILGARARARASVSTEKVFSIRIVEPGSSYSSAPTLTITDPNNIYDVPLSVRIGNGALANPSFINRGIDYVAANAELVTGDGFADYFQDGSFVAVKYLTRRPVPGSNVVFGHLPNTTFKLVNVVSFLGAADGSYTAFFQLSPKLPVFDSPESGTSVTTRIRYSQVRVTGHDFLDIGTGNFASTNYPGIPLIAANAVNETVENNGGRVFFTSTDQDGNFRVGDLFTIEQSTGIATLNADAFNISGLQELSLGEVTLGGASATITEFSTDPFLTANSDNVVPTQRAVKAYISSQIGGGGASLNVNSVTAGSIFIATNEISSTTNETIYITAKTNFKGGVRGLPVAWNFFFN